MKACFKSDPVPTCFQKYMTAVYKLGYKEEPNYKDLKKLFLNELKGIGMKDDATGLDWIDSPTKPTKRKVRHGTVNI